MRSLPGSLLAVQPENPYRLPRTVVPRHYELTLEPDLADASFAGRVEIGVEVRHATDVVVVNAAELQISSAEVEQGGQRILVFTTRESAEDGSRTRALDLQAGQFDACSQGVDHRHSLVVARLLGITRRHLSQCDLVDNFTGCHQLLLRIQRKL